MRLTRGFTLIELLVVIAIIGLLASIILAALTSARAKARDIKIIADLNQVSKALELYYSSNGYYPPLQTTSTTKCTGTDESSNGWADLTAALVPTYINQMPHDPSDTTLGYQYCSEVASPNKPQEYMLRASTIEKTVPSSGFKGQFFTVWGGDDPSCATGYCMAVCANFAGAEGPSNQSLNPPNCGHY